MIGHAFTRAATGRFFAPWTPSATRKNCRAAMSVEPGFSRKINLLQGSFVNRMQCRLYIWQDRAEQRGRLSTMDARILKDIGITRHDAVQEARKPFWMA